MVATAAFNELILFMNVGTDAHFIGKSSLLMNFTFSFFGKSIQIWYWFSCFSDIMDLPYHQ